MFEGGLTVGIIQKPAIVVKEDSFLTARLGGYQENNETGVRSIGFAFMRRGRAIGLWEEVDYRRKLQSNREESSKQLVPGNANVVFIDGADVIGDPESHKKYLTDAWLTEELTACSGVVLFEPHNNERLTYYENPYAAIKAFIP